VIVLGPTDTGKTTWLAALAGRSACEHSILVSTDPGQITFGAPGLLSAAPRDPEIERIQATMPRKLYFTGKNMPSGNLLQIIHGVHRLVRWARTRANLVLVDTDGYVTGGAAREYKRLMLSRIRPCLAVFMGDDPSLTPIREWARSLDNVETLRVSPPGQRDRKDMSTRDTYRRTMLKRWFRHAEVREISFREHIVYSQYTGIGKPLPNEEIIEISDILDTQVLHAEATYRWVNILVAHEPSPGQIQELRHTYPERTAKIIPVTDWKHHLIGDFRGDGLSSGMGYVAGWSAESRSLVIRGRFLREPGRIWLVGEETYPEDA